MTVKMISLFKEERKISRKRDEAYARVYAETDGKRRADKLKKARSLDSQLSSTMAAINEQARKEGIVTKSNKRHKKR